MLDRSLVVPERQRRGKRPHGNDEESENSISPPKINATPRTRRQVIAETTPKATPSVTYYIHTPIEKMKSPKPLLDPNAGLKLSKTKMTKRCRSVTPEVPVRRTRRSVSMSPNLDICVSRSGRSRSTTPVNNRGKMQHTPISLKRTCNEKRVTTPKSRETVQHTSMSSKKPSSHKPSCSNKVKGLHTPISSKKASSSNPSCSNMGKVQHTPISSKKVNTPKSNSKKNLKVDQTSQIPLPIKSSRTLGITQSPSSISSQIESETSSTIASGELKMTINDSIESKLSDCTQEEKSSCPEVDSENTYTSQMESTQGTSHTSVENVTESYDKLPVPELTATAPHCQVEESSTPSGNSAQECEEEVEKEIRKVKKRRSTIGSGRKSGPNFGGRRSLCPSIPALSLEDQISNIDIGLPRTSKISHLLDISLRETMRRLAEQCEGEDSISDMRLQLITNSESIGGHAAYKIAGMPLVAGDFKPQDTVGNKTDSSKKAALLKNKTLKLEQEYRGWKTLLKERKLACQAAEREYCEAKSGDTKIEDDNMKNLTNIQRSFLASKPQYNRYIKEVALAREKNFFVMQEIKHTTNVISHFVQASKAVADSCYEAVEEMTFGSTARQPVKSVLNTLLTLGESKS